MDEASRVAFERRMAQFNSEALAVFGIAQALLAVDGRGLGASLLPL